MIRHVTILVLLLAASAFGQVADPHVHIDAALNTPALRPGQDAVLGVTVDIKGAFHTQSHTPLDKNLIPLAVQLKPNPAVAAGQAVYPPGQIVSYPALGKLSVYTGKVVVYVPVRVKPDARPGDLALAGTVSYQVCDERSCFPPQEQAFSATAKIDPQARLVAPPKIAAAGPAWSTAYAFAIAFVAGLFFNVMPCVLPVLPLKAMGFYEVAQHRRDKSLALGAIFSAGVIAFFAAIALLILVSKTITWGQQFSNPYFVWGIVIVLAAMGLGLFGAFDIVLPNGVYRFTPRHDTIGGNFLFGVFTAVLSTPCTAPLFPPLMLWAAAQPVLVGIPAVMMVGAGMASPYLLLSAFPEVARKLPRTGPWSGLVKQMMGFLLLIAATYFAAGQIIAGADFWWAVVGMTAIAGIYLVVRAMQLSRTAFGPAVAAMLAIAATGGVAFFAVQATGLLSRRADERAWTTFSPQALQAARDQKKLVLVKFTANWCANCQYVEASVFGNRRTWDALRSAGVVTLKADMTRPNPPAQELLKQLNPAGGIPLTAIYSPNWDRPLTLDSVYTSDTLLNAIREAQR